MRTPHNAMLDPASAAPGSLWAPVVDPTKNVLDTLNAAVRRQDDLLGAEHRFQETSLVHVEEMARLRSEHAKELRELESRRIDANRQSDANAIKTEADRALAAIQALAATTAAENLRNAQTTASNAENLRTALQNTAATIAKQTSDTVSQILERIAALEKSSYTGAGKEAVTDPAITRLAEEVGQIHTFMNQTKGQTQGIHAGWLVLTGGVAILATLVSIGGAIYSLTRPTPTPAVIYAPAQPAPMPPPQPYTVPSPQQPQIVPPQR